MLGQDLQTNVFLGRTTTCGRLLLTVTEVTPTWQGSWPGSSTFWGETVVSVTLGRLASPHTRRHSGQSLQENDPIVIKLLKTGGVHLPSRLKRWTISCFWENVHPPPCVTCRMSGVTCHMSGVRCQVSCVTCQVSDDFIFYFIFFKVVELVGGGSVINGA